MPLFDINTPHYLNRKRFFLDSASGVQDGSLSRFDAVYSLGTSTRRSSRSSSLLLTSLAS